MLLVLFACLFGLTISICTLAFPSGHTQPMLQRGLSGRSCIGVCCVMHPSPSHFALLPFTLATHSPCSRDPVWQAKRHILSLGKILTISICTSAFPSGHTQPMLRRGLSGRSSVRASPSVVEDPHHLILHLRILLWPRTAHAPERPLRQVKPAGGGMAQLCGEGGGSKKDPGTFAKLSLKVLPHVSWLSFVEKEEAGRKRQVCWCRSEL